MHMLTAAIRLLRRLSKCSCVVIVVSQFVLTVQIYERVYTFENKNLYVGTLDSQKAKFGCTAAFLQLTIGSVRCSQTVCMLSTRVFKSTVEI